MAKGADASGEQHPADRGAGRQWPCVLRSSGIAAVTVTERLTTRWAFTALS